MIEQLPQEGKGVNTHRAVTVFTLYLYRCLFAPQMFIIVTIVIRVKETTAVPSVCIKSGSDASQSGGSRMAGLTSGGPPGAGRKLLVPLGSRNRETPGAPLPPQDPPLLTSTSGLAGVRSERGLPGRGGRISPEEEKHNLKSAKTAEPALDPWVWLLWPYFWPCAQGQEACLEAELLDPVAETQVVLGLGRTLSSGSGGSL